MKVFYLGIKVKFGNIKNDFRTVTNLEGQREDEERSGGTTIRNEVVTTSSMEALPRNTNSISNEITLNNISERSAEEVSAQGDKLDERISSMRSEISELKQWIMMLQKNAEGHFEQGDIADTYLDEFYRKVNLEQYKTPP